MFWERFEALCNSVGKKPNVVAEELGISSGSITNWKQKKITPGSKNLKKLADYFKVSIDYLADDDQKPYAENKLSEMDNIFPITRKAFPLLGDIACGEPIYADENRESYIMAGTEINADFCLRAKGDSMIGARILDGDIVFIKKTPVVENGSIAAVIIGDEATLKRVYYYPKQKKLVLNSENPKYEPFVYIGEELDQICILGKAVAFQSDVF